MRSKPICEKNPHKFEIPRVPFLRTRVPILRFQKFHKVTIENRVNGMKSVFNVPKRYKNLGYLSSGAQGTVATAFDTATGRLVAIKKMEQVFTKAFVAKRAYREFMLITTIKHPNIIPLLNAFTPDSTFEKFQEVYLVMELMYQDLYKAIHKPIRIPGTLPPQFTHRNYGHQHLSYIVYQMLRGIQHLHNSGVIHRDLKPSNIVIDETCKLKILDFGLARKKNIDVASRMSEYVVTRYYRAPEVIFGMEYNEKVDIWSIGCIFAEIVNRAILFPGEDTMDQGRKIIAAFGCPDEQFLEDIPQGIGRFLKNNYGEVKAKTISEIVPEKNFQRSEQNKEIPEVNWTVHQAQDLLSKMLKLNPKERCSVEEALNHPYLGECVGWDKEDNISYPAPNPIGESRYDEDIETIDKPLEEWKALIFGEIQKYQKEHDVFQG